MLVLKYYINLHSFNNQLKSIISNQNVFELKSLHFNLANNKIKINILFYYNIIILKSL